MRARICQRVHRVQRLVPAEFEDDRTIVEYNRHIVHPPVPIFKLREVRVE